MRRKGEISPAALDRGWPHQVAIDELYVVANFDAVQTEAERLDVAPRGHSVGHAGIWYTVYCFAEAEAAEAFRMRFGGLPFNPKDRGKGRSWAQWHRPV